MLGDKFSSLIECEDDFSITDYKQLFNFYKDKYEENIKKEDKYKDKINNHLKALIADRHDLEAENYRRAQKISDLQKALIVTQLSCFEERERFLNVSAENERLKKNELLLHRNMRMLLKHTKDKELHDRVIYTLSDPKLEICYRYAGEKSGSSTSSLTEKKSDDLLREQASLKKFIDSNSARDKIKQIKESTLYETLKKKLEDLKKKEEASRQYQLKTFKDDFFEYSSKMLGKLEAVALQSSDTLLSAEARISAYRSEAKNMSLKLKETDELLTLSIDECLNLRQKLRKEELKRERAEAISKKEILQSENPNLKPKVPAVKEVAPKIPTAELRTLKRPYEEKVIEMRASIKKLQTELKSMNNELKDERKKYKLSQQHTEKKNVEFSIEKESLKTTMQSLEARNASLLDQLKILKNRDRRNQEYRRLEIEGFKTDIKLLKQKINDLEKQLVMAVLMYENDQKSIELLKNVHATAQRSKAAVDALKRLKRKLYEIETDLKHL